MMELCLLKTSFIIDPDWMTLSSTPWLIYMTKVRQHIHYLKPFFAMHA